MMYSMVYPKHDSSISTAFCNAGMRFFSAYQASFLVLLHVCPIAKEAGDLFGMATDALIGADESTKMWTLAV